MAEPMRPEGFLRLVRGFEQQPPEALRNRVIAVAVHDEQRLRDRADARERLEPVFHEPTDRHDRNRNAATSTVEVYGASSTSAAHSRSAAIFVATPVPSEMPYSTIDALATP